MRGLDQVANKIAKNIKRRFEDAAILRASSMLLTTSTCGGLRMQSRKRAFAYGFLVWLFTLMVSMAAFPLKRSWSVLFDSVMAVALALSAVIFANRYFERCAVSSLREGAELGAIWLVLNWLLDWPLFSYGPMRMSMLNYLADIGLTYLMLPIITVGIAYQAAAMKKTKEGMSDA
jgi:uncharacterized membrane protein YpjA